MMDNETIKELAEGVNGGIIAATKRLERAIMKLKAENEGLKARVRDSVGCIQRIERTTTEQDVRDIIDEYKDNIK